MQAHNVPMVGMSERMGKMIGSMISEVLEHDGCVVGSLPNLVENTKILLTTV